MEIEKVDIYYLVTLAYREDKRVILNDLYEYSLIHDWSIVTNDILKFMTAWDRCLVLQDITLKYPQDHVKRNNFVQSVDKLVMGIYREIDNILRDNDVRTDMDKKYKKGYPSFCKNC